MDVMLRFESFKYAVESTRKVYQIPMLYVFMGQQS